MPQLAEACREHIAHYKLPKAFIRTDKVLRSPAGKADYRWAKELAVESLAPKPRSPSVTPASR